MNKWTIYCDYTILDDYKYKLIKDDTSLFAEVDFYSPIKSFFRGNKIYRSKISIKNETGDTLVKIYKHHPTPIKDVLYTVVIDDYSYTIREGRNFKIPDLYLRTNTGRFNIWGKVNSKEFDIIYKNNSIAKIEGHFENKTKDYDLLFEDEYAEFENLFLSVVLILDNMYHYY
ncbi:Hypothetical protein ING2D1G_1234 [Peptoniphilus sp. ING2-D1G]|nr:Hypothetical protein ING2D1G_1234 [Peptoniphilus sp. ING2-D1G]